MSGDFPIDDSVFVLKGEERLGPYGIEELLDMLETGEVCYEDLCLREGAHEYERVRDVLDWDSQDSESNDDPDFAEEPSDSTPTPGAILYSGQPSILTYPGALCAIFGGIVGGIWLFPFSGWFSVVGGAVSLLGTGYLTFVRFTSDYIVTPKRIELITGLVAKSSNEVRIDDLKAINVTCRGLGGMIGIGTIDFFTSGDEPEIQFRNVWNAKKVKGLVRRIQDGNP